MVDLVAVGDVLLDVVAARPEAGELVHGPVVVRAGGSAVNAARAAVAAGGRALVVGCVGDDAAGYAIQRELERDGIEAALAVDEAMPTGVALLLDDAVVATHGANAALRVDELPPARATLVSGYLAPAADPDGRRDRVLCRTLGPDGAVAVRGDERAEAVPAVVRDGPLPGAGDAFAAIFALALAEGAALGDALRRACDAGSRV